MESCWCRFSLAVSMRRARPEDLLNLRQRQYLLDGCSEITFSPSTLVCFAEECCECGLGTDLALCTWDRLKLKHRPIRLPAKCGRALPRIRVYDIRPN
jgi:hypothetical protein